MTGIGILLQDFSRSTFIFIHPLALEKTKGKLHSTFQTAALCCNGKLGSSHLVIFHHGMTFGGTEPQIIGSLWVIQITSTLPELHRSHGITLYADSGITADSQHINGFRVVVLRRFLETLRSQSRVLVHSRTGEGKFAQTAERFREIMFGSRREILHSLLEILLGPDTCRTGFTHEFLRTRIPQLRALASKLYGFVRVFLRAEAHIITLCQVKTGQRILLFGSGGKQLEGFLRTLFTTAEPAAVRKSQHRHRGSVTFICCFLPPLTGHGRIFLHAAAPGICIAPQQIHRICMSGFCSLLPPLNSLGRITGSVGLLVAFQTTLRHLHHLIRGLRLRFCFNLLLCHRYLLRGFFRFFCPFIRAGARYHATCHCHHHH